MFVFWSEQAWKRSAVVNTGRCNRISVDKSMIDIDADAVFVAVANDAVLHCLASI